MPMLNERHPFSLKERGCKMLAIILFAFLYLNHSNYALALSWASQSAPGLRNASFPQNSNRSTQQKNLQRGLTAFGLRSGKDQAKITRPAKSSMIGVTLFSPESMKVANAYEFGLFSKRFHGNNIPVMRVRGGDVETESESDDEDEEDLQSEEHSDSDSEESSIEEEYTSNGDEDVENTSAISAEELEVAQEKAKLSQQSRNFGIATALWSSLFFDSILNKAKRCDLFPTLGATAGTTAAATMIPTALLASGFAMASGVSFLLWRDLDIRSDTSGDEIGKGDWFLSLSNTDKDGDAESDDFASKTRKRLSFHLALFGILSLGANASYLFSDQAPFLGMSAAIINVHNALVCVSALVKEKGILKEMLNCVSMPMSFVQSCFKRDLGSFQENLSFLFHLSAVFAWLRCLPVCNALVLLARGLMKGGTDVAAGAALAITPSFVDDARQFSLEFASLARLTVLAGIFHTMSSSIPTKYNNSPRSFLRHPFFITLSGMISLMGFGVSGTMILSTLMATSNATGLLSKGILVDAIFMLLLGVASGYYSLSSFLLNMRKSD